MKKILGIKIPDSKTLTEANFIDAAKECGFSKLIGVNLYSALQEYAHELYMVGKIKAREMPISQKFLYKIPETEIETIKGIKAAGHKIIEYMKTL